VQGFGSYWFKSLASIDFILVEGEGCLGEAMPRPVYYCRFSCCMQKKSKFKKQAEPAEINAA